MHYQDIVSYILDEQNQKFYQNKVLLQNLSIFHDNFFQNQFPYKKNKPQDMLLSIVGNLHLSLHQYILKN